MFYQNKLILGKCRNFLNLFPSLFDTNIRHCNSLSTIQNKKIFLNKIRGNLKHINLHVRNMSSESASEVIFEEVDCKGIITLNRPKALNTLNMEMVREIYPMLKKWENNKKLVIIKGSGEKAFCAGGDVIRVTKAGKAGESLIKDFFREEYTLNNLIGTFQIPYIAFIDGITMGGGVGLSVHGEWRVATERTVFAMPETAIGIFPDVGGGYFLPRLGGGLGMFLALTGVRLRGGDVLRAGVATHYCESNRLSELQAALLALPAHTEQQHVRGVLDSFHSQPPDFSLTPHLATIKQCFNYPTLQQILNKLKESEDPWSKKQLEVMERMCPTSLVLTHEQLTRGASMSLQDCLIMEYRLMRRCCQHTDFYEGVRALLQDKDNKPVWQPSSLSQVDVAATIKRYFAPLPPSEEDLSF